jgi:hypothetical protein
MAKLEIKKELWDALTNETKDMFQKKYEMIIKE